MVAQSPDSRSQDGANKSDGDIPSRPQGVFRQVRRAIKTEVAVCRVDQSRADDCARHVSALWAVSHGNVPTNAESHPMPLVYDDHTDLDNVSDCLVVVKAEHARMRLERWGASHTSNHNSKEHNCRNED